MNHFLNVALIIFYFKFVFADNCIVHWKRHTNRISSCLYCENRLPMLLSEFVPFCWASKLSMDVSLVKWVAAVAIIIVVSFETYSFKPMDRNGVWALKREEGKKRPSNHIVIQFNRAKCDMNSLISDLSKCLNIFRGSYLLTILFCRRIWFAFGKSQTDPKPNRHVY